MPDRNARRWLPLAAFVAGCTLWWGFARTMPLVGLLFGIRPGQLIFDVNFFFVRAVAVWVLSVTVAMVVLVAGVLFRTRATEGPSPSAFGYRLLSLTATALTIVTGMELWGRPLSSPGPWIGFVAYALLSTAQAWRTMRSSRGGA